MIATLNIYEAKTQFSSLLTRVEKGDEITIARAGRPVARLVPIGVKEPLDRRGMFGIAKDTVNSEDWDAWPEGFIESLTAGM